MWYGISRGAWSPSCILRVMTSWKPCYLKLQITSQEYPSCQQKEPHSLVMILPPRRLGDYHMPSWPPREDPWAWRCSQSSRHSECTGVDTTATSRVQTTHLGVWPTSSWRYMALSILGEAWLDITSFASIEMITVRNTLTDEFECHYQMQLISVMSLCLNPFEAHGQPGTDQELKD